MAVYFDHRVQAVQPGTVSDFAWHKTYPLVAVATYNETSGGSVNIYQDEVCHLILLIFYWKIL